MAARKKLSKIENLKIVGITGSYGKTTTKEILLSILRSRFRTFATPANVNTDVGIADFVNNNMDWLIDVLIVEMGAYKRGEIEKICNLVPPDVSIITAVSEQHLALFGKLEYTFQAKYEIVESAKEDAVVVLNGDNDLCLRIAGKSGRREILYSTSRELDLWASDMKSTKDSVSFNVHYKGKKQRFHVRMLGEYNISNVLAATAVALQFDMNLKEIAQALTKASKTKRIGRLSLRKSKYGYKVIDDSYNSNSAGFIAALEYVHSLKARKRILVTIGIIELGGGRIQIYDSLAEKIVKVCDVLVTTDKKLLQAVKTLDTHFKIVFDQGVEKQLHFLREEVHAQDVVLFEGPNLRLIKEIIGKS